MAVNNQWLGITQIAPLAIFKLRAEKPRAASPCRWNVPISA